MNVLVVGSGAREHALAWKLVQSPKVDALFAAPGNAGTGRLGANWPELSSTSIPGIVAKAVSAKVGLAVIGPEAALAAGLADALRAAGIAAFGPDRSGARLESSKAFAKQFMARFAIPAPSFFIVRDHKQAKKILRDWPADGGVVVKADGLAAGKGVVVCDSAVEARDLADGWYSRGAVPGGGSTLVLEERLEGREVSMMAVTDGRRAVLFAPARDYKRAGDGDSGPNTGGMGAYAPAGDVVDAGLRNRVYKEIFQPTLEGLRRAGIAFRGCLYAGLMITPRGPRVLEFNVRFGDPETQVVLPLFEGDFCDLLLCAAEGRLEADRQAEFSARACTGIVLASKGYPARSEPVHNLPTFEPAPPVERDSAASVVGFWGASTLEGERVDAAGGRVLTVCALGEDLRSSRDAAYAACVAYQRRLPAEAQLWCRSDISLTPPPDSGTV